MAGGLDPALAAGTLVLPWEVVTPEGTRYLTAHDWREGTSSAIATICPVCGGRLLTSHEALCSVAAKTLAFRHTAAVAVDMESSAVAAVAAEARLPFLAVRAIVDTAREAVPQAALSAAAPGTGAVRIGQLLGALARTPYELPAMIRLASGYAAARRALAAVARSGALAPKSLGPVVGRPLR
jgi:hypothetical protein